MTTVALTTDVDGVGAVVLTLSETVVANEAYFGELDAVVGDGDFGYSLARGFEAVVSDWSTFDRTDTSTFLKAVAFVLSRKVGGTSGPIWSTGFLRAAMTAGSKETLDGADIVAMLRASVEGIKKRGNADLGDKTLLDALVPTVDEIELALSEETDAGAVVARAAVAARTSAEATASLQAKRGRASYSGERSIGSPDAGAVAIAVLLESLAERWPATNPSINDQQEATS